VPDIETRADLALELQERLVGLVRSLGLHQPDRASCGCRVSVGEVHVLMELGRSEGVAQRELAAWLRLEKSTVSRLVSVLEGRGWVERFPDPSGGRSPRLRLTGEGRWAAGQLAEARRAGFVGVVDAVPPADRDGVLDAVDTLVEAVRTAT